MTKMIKVLPFVAVALLAGCKSAADRMYECEAQGISRDACYVAEQNRTATMNAQAQAQAYRNADSLYGAKGTETNKHKHHHHSDNDDDE